MSGNRPVIAAIAKDTPGVMRDRHDEPLGMPAALRALVSVMHGDSSSDAVLRRACDAAKAVIPVADEVSVTLVERDGPRTAATSGPLAVAADESQYAAGEGPCLDAARTGSTVVVPDLAEDDRWPSYAPTGLALGVRGSFSVPLQIDALPQGAMNVYRAQPGAFDESVIDVASDLARYTGIVVAATDEWHRATLLAEQMQLAMQSRAVIEQAKGILMAERRCRADEAFDVLVRLSQESHLKLREVAQTLVNKTVDG